MAKIHLFVKGNLVAESLIIAAEALCTLAEGYEIRMITDGYLPALPDNVSTQCSRIAFNGAEINFNPADILITGLMWPGDAERKLISSAKAAGALTIIMYPDIAGTVEKFLVGGETLLTDYICVADKITYENLLLGGVPGEIIIPLGSLYLDKIIKMHRSNIPVDSGDAVGYLSVPNKNDFDAWERHLGYDELEIAADLAAVCGTRNTALRIRKHPKEYELDKYGAEAFTLSAIENHSDCSILEFIDGCSAIVSSYSTALVIAKKMGKLAISYQPNCVNPARASLYHALDIPVVTDCKRLEATLFAQNSSMKVSRDYVLFNNDRAQEMFVDFIRGVSACAI